MFTKLGKTMYCFIVIILLISALTSCNESEPLPEGFESMADMNTDDFRDENGVLQWPAEILPEGFPVPVYEDIYSIERKDNIVTITVFSEFSIRNLNDLKMPHNDFSIALTNNGYFMYSNIGNNPDSGGYYYNKSDKTNVVIYQSRMGQNFYGAHLETVNEKSPTDFTMQIIVSKAELTPESMLWDYPSADTDLGLEYIEFDEWPAEYLPDDIPNPTGQGIDVKLTMVQRKNGVFITVSGDYKETGRFRTLIRNKYANVSYHDGNKYNDTYMNKNGDYIYFEILSSVPNENSAYDVEQYQICKFNEFVKKGDQQ